jgi:hypothetical protein
MGMISQELVLLGRARERHINLLGTRSPSATVRRRQIEGEIRKR